MTGYQPIPKSDAEKSIALSVVLTLLTCGIYNIYWNYVEMRTMNGLLGRDEFNFFQWALLTPLTCGIYHIYYEYKCGAATVELQRKYGLTEDRNLPVLFLALSIFGLSLVADAIQQGEINKIYAKQPVPGI